MLSPDIHADTRSLRCASRACWLTAPAPSLTRGLRWVVEGMGTAGIKQRVRRSCSCTQKSQHRVRGKISFSLYSLLCSLILC